jgi:UDP-N-acetylglucosamine diphosphorylase/glucosamine-1-phosphate N-acetyltransferase
MAGGLGKRMKSELPKVLHKVQGVPMLVRVIREASKLNPAQIMVIVGQYKPVIESTLKEYLSKEQINKITFVIQDTALGTGHAIQCTLDELDKIENKNNSVNLILSGDVPLIKYDTMRNIIDSFVNKQNNLLQITCTSFNDPTGFGRIITQNNQFQKIVEHKDCNEEQLNVKLCNSGIYVANINILHKYLPLIDNKNAQNEYYLTDIVEITKHNEGENVVIDLYEIEPSKQIELTGINTKEQLEELNSRLNEN